MHHFDAGQKKGQKEEGKRSL